MANSLIVVPGLSSGGMVRRLLRKEDRSVSDVLACSEDFTFGPVLNTDDPERLLRLRHRHWLRVTRDEPYDLPRPRFSWRSLLGQSAQTEVWLGGTGSEQLFLLGLNHFIRAVRVDENSVRILQYPAPRFWESLGTKRVEELEIRPAPVVLTSDLSERLNAIWLAITSPTPEALFDAFSRGTAIPELPYLDRGLSDLVTSYPDAKTGLTLMDERLLTALPEEWTKAARVIGNAMIGDDQQRPIGDLILFGRLVELAGARQVLPAVELRGNPKVMRECEVRIARFGADCLAGHHNYLETNGINLWIGGVHLNSAENRVWCRGPNMSLVRAI